MHCSYDAFTFVVPVKSRHWVRDGRHEVNVNTTEAVDGDSLIVVVEEQLSQETMLSDVICTFSKSAQIAPQPIAFLPKNNHHFTAL